MGAPDFVFFPLTAQLLLPLSLSGRACTLPNESLRSRYSESIEAGGFTAIAGGGKMVPFGTMGSRESCKYGYIFSKSFIPNAVFAFVYSKSSSFPANSNDIYFRNSAVFRFVHFSGV